MVAIRSTEAANHGRLIRNYLQSFRSTGSAGKGQLWARSQFEGLQVQDPHILDGILPVDLVASSRASMIQSCLILSSKSPISLWVVELKGLCWDLASKAARKPHLLASTTQLVNKHGVNMVQVVKWIALWV